MGKSADSSTLTAVVFDVQKNVMVNGVDIYRELDAGFTNYLAKEYENFGRSLGSAFVLTFIGADGKLPTSDT